MSRKISILALSVCLCASWASSVFAEDAVIRLVGKSPAQVHHDPLDSLYLSSGLSTIGLGQAIYIKSDLEGTYAWTIAGPTGSAAVLSGTTDREVSFKPDSAGAYVVTLDFTDADGTTSDSVTINGATYVGAESCNICHPTKHAKWLETDHVSLFSIELDNAAGHYGEGCIMCHTTGYDADSAAVNGGFDDVATAEGWTFPETLQEGNYADLVANYPNTAKLAGIQCENCHGPGSEHLASSMADKAATIATNLSNDACAICHDEPPRHDKGSEWRNSAHGHHGADPPADEHYNRSGTRCAGCHTAQGFFDVNLANVPPEDAYSYIDGITCMVCHDPHDATNEYQLRAVRDSSNTDSLGVPQAAYISDGTPGTTCNVCHHLRSGKEKPGEQAPHHSHQSEMLAGTVGYMNPDVTYPETNPHATLTESGCVSCHMVSPAYNAPKNGFVGSHTFNMKMLADPENEHAPAVDIYHTEVCAECHPGIGEDFDYNGFQSKVTLMLNELEPRFPLATVGRLAGSVPAHEQAEVDASVITVDQMNAVWNWFIVSYDNSKGIHNPAMTMALLEDALSLTTATAECLSCDINGDGKLGISDAISLILMGAEDNTQACIDRNGDFVYDISDVIKLVSDIWAGSCGGTMLAGAGVELIHTQIELTADQIQHVQSVIEQMELTSEQAAAFEVALFGDGSGKSSLPKAFSLGQNAPNPFNPSTTIKFAVPEGNAGVVTLKVYDVRGRLVRSLVDGAKESGNYTVFWDGTNQNGQQVSSGVYFYRMVTGEFTQTRKMVMLK